MYNNFVVLLSLLNGNIFFRHIEAANIITFQNQNIYLNKLFYPNQQVCFRKIVVVIELFV